MKIVVIVIIGIFGHIQSASAGEVTLAHTQNEMKFDYFTSTPKGFAIGYKGNYESYSPYVEYQSTVDSEINLDYSAFNFGTQIIMFSQYDFTLGFNLEAGYGVVAPEKASNDFNFLSLGGGGFLNYFLNESLSIFINGQYMYYSEVTPNTECRDGSSSESSGSGTCSHHGGIAYYNDKIGDANGLKFNVGLSFSF